MTYQIQQQRDEQDPQDLFAQRRRHGYDFGAHGEGQDNGNGLCERLAAAKKKSGLPREKWTASNKYLQSVSVGGGSRWLTNRSTATGERDADCLGRPGMEDGRHLLVAGLPEIARRPLSTPISAGRVAVRSVRIATLKQLGEPVTPLGRP